MQTLGGRRPKSLALFNFSDCERAVRGDALHDLKMRVAARLAAGDRGDEREFEMYPHDLKSPYRDRQSNAAAQRYAALGISREDNRAREQAIEENWNCFGSTAALFCYIDRDMGLPQWSDIGMYLQTIMLLLRAEGLHSCPQLAWSVYRRSVAQVVSPPRVDAVLWHVNRVRGFYRAVRSD